MLGAYKAKMTNIMYVNFNCPTPIHIRITYIQLLKFIWFGHWLPDFFFFFSAPTSSHSTLLLSWRLIPKSMRLLRYKFYFQTHPVSTDFFYQFYIINIAKTFSCKLHRSVDNRRKHTVYISGCQKINLLRWVLPTHTRTVEI
jgi:hypothetical protein